MAEPLFRSFFLGGFECSTHRLRSGKRLDMIAATRHDKFAREDYLRLQGQGIRTVRDGIRWHLIEFRRGLYNFSSALPLVRAARDTRTQVIWDLCHYGWPNFIDILKPEFVKSLARIAYSFTRILSEESDEIPFITPINEISFFAWAAGQVGYLNPFKHKRGHEFKEQLVRAAIEVTEAVWDVNPRARIVHVDPLIHVVADLHRPSTRRAAEGYRLSQYEAWDMLGGMMKPELGGAPKYLDLIGVNYYSDNQWFYSGLRIDRAHPQYRPFREMLQEVHARYGRPLFVAETGIEDETRPEWLRYVSEEVAQARDSGVPVEGICLYPIVNHPGWDNDRHCHNGLWDYADDEGEREIYLPLAQELYRQRSRCELRRRCSRRERNRLEEANVGAPSAGRNRT